MTKPYTWTNGFGIWYVRVPRSESSPIFVARAALRDELQACESRSQPCAPWVWMNPIHVPLYDDADTIVYRESDRGGESTIAYGASVLLDLLDAGPHEGDDFYRVRAIGSTPRTKWFNVSPAQLLAFAEIMNRTEPIEVQSRDREMLIQMERFLRYERTEITDEDVEVDGAAAVKRHADDLASQVGAAWSLISDHLKRS